MTSPERRTKQVVEEWVQVSLRVFQDPAITDRRLAIDGISYVLTMHNGGEFISEYIKLRAQHMQRADQGIIYMFRTREYTQRDGPLGSLSDRIIDVLEKFWVKKR